MGYALGKAQHLVGRIAVTKRWKVMDALLDTPDALAARAAMLDADHVRPIEAWRRTQVAPGPIPHADPADGGVGARLLLLLETPGPGAEPLRFVSRDNPTGTGRNLRRFLVGAEIGRADTLIWNAVPWVVHALGARNRPVRVGEVRDGLAMLPGFLDLLPQLAVVVLSGRIAAQAAPVAEAARPGLPVILVPHPSPTIVCTSPAVGARIEAGLGQAALILAGVPHPPSPFPLACGERAPSLSLREREGGASAPEG